MSDMGSTGGAGRASEPPGALARAARRIGRLLRSAFARRAAAPARAPGPALTTPEEIGLGLSAGGPMPDRITPGDDIGLGASPAVTGQDHAGLDGAPEQGPDVTRR